MLDETKTRKIIQYIVADWQAGVPQNLEQMQKDLELTDEEWNQFLTDWDVWI